MSKRDDRPLGPRIHRNERRTCRHPHCDKNRAGMASYCVKHKGIHRAWGHAEATGSLPLREMKPELKEVEEFLSHHPNHPAKRAVCRFIDIWLEGATHQGVVPGCKTMARLRAGGVTSLQVATTACAAWLYTDRRKHFVPDDIRFTYVLGNCVGILNSLPVRMYYSPTTGGMQRRSKELSGKERREIGEYLRENIGIFMHNVVQSIETQPTPRELVKSFMRTPFVDHTQLLAGHTVEEDQPEDPPTHHHHGNHK